MQSISHLKTTEKIKHRHYLHVIYMVRQKKDPQSVDLGHLDRSNCNMLWFQIGFHVYFNICGFLYSKNFQPTQPRWNLLLILGQIIKDFENKRFVIFPPCENLSLLNILLYLLASCCCFIYIFMHKIVYISVSNKMGLLCGLAFLDFYKKLVRPEFSSQAPSTLP